MASTKVKSANITDLAVTTGKLAADAVTGAKIADNAVDSEHITAGAIDTAHLGDSQVTAGKLATTLDLSSKTLTLPTSAIPWTYGSQVATTSGTTVELVTGIPDTVKEIEIMISGLSTSGNAQPPMLQLGDAGDYEATGYNTITTLISAANCNEDAVTTGFNLIRATTFLAADTHDGVLRLVRWDTSEHQWFATGQFIASSGYHCSVAGVKTTSAALTRIQLTTPGGTATFDAGEARVRYR